ncbi:MAG: outer membrane protein assembly factor BamE [Thalassovita sp.]
MLVTGKKVRTLVAGVALFGLIGCSSTYRNHGYVPSEQELSEILVGVDTRDSVAESVGTPTISALVNDSAYFYVRSQVKHFAYRRPQETERQVVAIRFDSNGVVSNVERFGLEDGNVVALSRRVTDSNVQDKSFLRQLLGNIGNVSAGDFL